MSEEQIEKFLHPFITKIGEVVKEGWALGKALEINDTEVEKLMLLVFRGLGEKSSAKLNWLKK